MESQTITGFEVFTKQQEIELKRLLMTYFEPYRKELILHSHLVQWRYKQRKYKKFRKEDFIFDGFSYNTATSDSSILYVFDYKYNDRQTRRRILKMQEFISKHCFDSNIKNYSTSYLTLNKTNSKCIDTTSYVEIFEKEILKEICIIKPTIIVCLGCYDLVKMLFNSNVEFCSLSAINYIPIVDMLPPTINVNDRLYQVHFEYVYFRKFGWNI